MVVGMEAPYNSDTVTTFDARANGGDAPFLCVDPVASVPSVPASFSDRHEMQIEDVAVSFLNRVEQQVGWRPIEVDARDGGLRPFENHVLGFLDVDIAAAEVLEHVREHARPIAVTNHQHVR